jgi:fluoride ion exporter CrcB/FEX
MQLAGDRELLLAFLNIVLSVGAGLAATWFGTRLVQWMYGM